MSFGFLGSLGRGFGRLGAPLGRTSALSALLRQLGTPTLDLDFRSNSPESYGFVNSRTGTYYDIGSDGNYHAVASGTSDQPAYSPSGVNQGLGTFPGYTNLIDNNSCQGAVAGSATHLETNGDFTANPINASINTVQNGWQWSVNGGTGTVVWDGSSTVTITGDGTHAARFTTAAITTVVNQTYTIFVDLGSNTCSINVGTANGTSNLLSVTAKVANRQTYSFVATTTTSFISFQKTAATPTTIKHAGIIAGALPTNWECYTGNSNAGNITASVTAVTTTFGIDVLRVRFSGTSSGAGSFLLNHTVFNHSVCTSGTVCQQQMFLQQQAGSQTNISSINFSLNESNSTPVFVQNDQSAALTVSTSGDYRLAKQVCNITTSNGAQAFAQPGIAINFAGAVAIDITLDIGWPMFDEYLDPRFYPPCRTTSGNASYQTDNINLTTAAFANTPGVVVQCEWYIPALNTLTNGFHPIPILFSDGTANNRWSLSCANGNGNPGGGAQILNAGSTIGIIDGAVAFPLDGNFHVQAGQMNTAGMAVAIDGGKYGVSATPPVTDGGGVAVDVFSSAAIAFTTVTLGRLLNGTDPSFGYLRRMRVWNNPAGITAQNIRTLSSAMPG
jgi:hypothetical protein